VFVYTRGQKNENETETGIGNGNVFGIL
jgi:hypothetical protein